MTSISGISSIAPQWNRPNVEGLASKASIGEAVGKGVSQEKLGVGTEAINTLAPQRDVISRLVEEVGRQDAGRNDYDRHGFNSH